MALIKVTIAKMYEHVNFKVTESVERMSDSKRTSVCASFTTAQTHCTQTHWGSTRTDWLRDIIAVGSEYSEEQLSSVQHWWMSGDPQIVNFVSWHTEVLKIIFSSRTCPSSSLVAFNNWTYTMSLFHSFAKPAGRAAPWQKNVNPVTLLF